MYQANGINASAKFGFTLIELMITLVILAILASIAIPSYLNYTRRAYYSEVVQATVPFKAGVAKCFQSTSDLFQCAAGSHDVPAAITTVTGAVASLVVVNGVITAIPLAQNGILATDTYILTPTVVNNSITWVASGGGVTAGYVK